MKVYPKVPRWDHPVVEDSFYDQPLTVLEKFDGSNLRWMVYENQHDYHPLVKDTEPEDGDIIIGTKKSIHGPISQDLEKFPGNLRRAIKQLREHFDVETARTLSEDGPVVYFAENMVRHTLDYGYGENPPPALIGFDIYMSGQDPRDEFASHPYEEVFEGYLPYDKMDDTFDKVFSSGADVVSAPVVERGVIDPEEIQVPISTHANIQAEGLVFRSETRRVKLVRDEFRELNKKMFGSDALDPLVDVLEESEDDHVRTARIVRSSGDAGAAYVATKFATRARIEKHTRKMLDNGWEFGMQLMAELPERVKEDIWTEEVHEISDLDMNINPSLVSGHIAQRCESELTKMKQNAELQGVEPGNLW